MIVIIILTVVLAGTGIFLLTGRGGFLIAGYNTSSKSEKANYNETALCRFMGIIVLIISAAILVMGLSFGGFLPNWAAHAGRALFFGTIIFALIYANTSPRIKKK